jgi:hypothetical protein
MLLWDSQDSKLYQRVWSACGVGHAGPVMRAGRGFILTADNVAELLKHLRRRWPEEVPPEPVAAHG